MFIEAIKKKIFDFLINFKFFGGAKVLPRHHLKKDLTDRLTKVWFYEQIVTLGMKVIRKQKKTKKLRATKCEFYNAWR